MEEIKMDELEMEMEDIMKDEELELSEKKGFLSKVKGGAKKHWKKILVGGIVAVGLVALGKKKSSKSDDCDCDCIGCDDDLDILDVPADDGIDVTEF